MQAVALKPLNKTRRDLPLRAAGAEAEWCCEQLQERGQHQAFVLSLPLQDGQPPDH